MSELADSLLTAAQCSSRAVAVGKNLRNVLKTIFRCFFQCPEIKHTQSSRMERSPELCECTFTGLLSGQKKISVPERLRSSPLRVFLLHHWVSLWFSISILSTLTGQENEICTYVWISCLFFFCCFLTIFSVLDHFSSNWSFALPDSKPSVREIPRSGN